MQITFNRKQEIAGIILLVIVGSLILFPFVRDYIVDDSENKDNIKIAIMDSGINKNHEGRKFIGEMIDKSFVDSVKYPDFMVSAEADSVETWHGDDVFTVLISHLLQYELVTVYNVRITGTSGEIDVNAVHDASLWLVEQDVDIVSMSFGGLYLEDQFLRGVTEVLIQQGVLVITAGGNRGVSNRVLNFIETPAIYPDSLTVGAYLDTQVLDFSSRGGTPFRTMKPDLVASSHGVVFNRGTSFTTPTVSAWAVNLYQDLIGKYNIKPTAGLVKILLMKGAIHINGAIVQAQGMGRANFENTIYYMSTQQSNFKSLFHAFPETIPIDRDILWLDIPYYYNLTITHSYPLSPNNFKLDVTTVGQIEVSQSYYSMYTSMLHVTYIPNNDDIVESITISNINTTQIIEIDPVTVETPLEMIYYDSSLSGWELDRNRYGQFFGLFEYLAEQGIALLDDPNYSYLNSYWVVDPYSDVSDSILLSEIFPDKRIFSMYSTFTDSGWNEFENRGWEGIENTVVNDISQVELFIGDFNVSIPYYGWFLKNSTETEGIPLTITGKLGNRTVGLIDDNWFGFLSNYPFDAYAFAGQYPSGRYLEFVNYVVAWLVEN